MKVAEFLVNEEYWCDNCDYHQVHSNKPQTGKVFIQSGHSYSPKDPVEHMQVRTVLFALCSECLSKFDINNMRH